MKNTFGAVEGPGVSAVTGSGRPRASSCQGDRNSTKVIDQNKDLWVVGSSGGSDKSVAATYDSYGGVIVDPQAVPTDVNVFRDRLRSSLVEWQALKKQGVWLQVGIERAELIPIATSEFGFEFHHAEKRHVMLAKWLPRDMPNTLPMNASHTVGIGAVVTDPQGRVLLVREKSGPAARLGIWKLPTGLVDAGEELHEAAVREVKEETGVDVTFEHLGAFIMNHGGNLAHANKSNIFFTVKCKATSSEISEQSGEIAEAKWFTQEEWHAMPFPEKDSVWDALNRSALTADAHLLAKQLPWGRNRPGTRWYHYPVPRARL